MLQQRLFYRNENLKNYPFIDTGTSMSIVAWQLMKNRSHIINDISIPGHLPHSGNSQRFKLDADSPSMPEKDIELFYCFIRRLLFTSKITISDVYVCVTYILTRIKLPTNYKRSRYLNIDILFMKKILLKYQVAECMIRPKTYYDNRQRNYNWYNANSNCYFWLG